MPRNRIVGIALLRDEEHFVAWSLMNVAGACDELIVVDNGSTDRTPEKLAALQPAIPELRVHRVRDPNRTHRYLEGFAGTRTWVLGVDGDEVYDPEGLRRFAERIRRGDFDDYWRIEGHMLHATDVDLEAGRARGFTTPRTPTVTKLYNFGAVESWREPNRQRLHGRSMVFRPGFSRGRILRLHRREGWEEADLRCLHLCFFPRTAHAPEPPWKRRNPTEVRVRGLRRLGEQMKNLLAFPFSGGLSYKARRYRRGPVVSRDLSGFGRPGSWRDLDPGAEEAERLLRLPADGASEGSSRRPDRDASPSPSSPPPGGGAG